MNDLQRATVHRALPDPSGRVVRHEWILLCPPHGAMTLIVNEYDRELLPGEDRWLPLDLGIHRAYEPDYEDAHRFVLGERDKCEYLEGPCWWDGSSLSPLEVWQSVRGLPEQERDARIYETLTEYAELWKLEQ